MLASINVRFFDVGSIVYNRVIEYKRKNFLKAVVHVILRDQCNQTVRLTKTK